VAPPGELPVKTAALTGVREITMRDVPVPRVESDDDVLIAVRSVGVCGSDIHYYATGRIGNQIVRYPFTVGHECAGVVEKTGAGVSRFKPGDRVAVEPAMPCYICDQCRAGRPHTCRNLKFLGCPGQACGCLSEYIVMPQKSCLPLPETVDFDGGAFSEPFAIGMYAVRQSVPMRGASVGILGAGPIGLSVLFAAQAEGARAVYMTDRLEYRAAFACRVGATWAGNPESRDVVSTILRAEPEGLDVVFECCGRQEAIDTGMELLKPGGKLMVIGIPGFERFSMPADLMRRKEICVQNVRRQNGCAEAALEAVSRGIVPVATLCTHSFPFDRTAEAFEVVAGYRDGVIKAMIHLNRLSRTHP